LVTNKLKVALAALLFACIFGCGQKDDIGPEPKSNVPGPGAEGMKEWAAKNPNNGTGKGESK
jgi:hypothetical protein